MLKYRADGNIFISIYKGLTFEIVHEKYKDSIGQVGPGLGYIYIYIYKNAGEIIPFRIIPFQLLQICVNLGRYEASFEAGVDTHLNKFIFFEGSPDSLYVSA